MSTEWVCCNIACMHGEGAHEQANSPCHGTADGMPCPCRQFIPPHDCRETVARELERLAQQTLSTGSLTGLGLRREAARIRRDGLGATR